MAWVQLEDSPKQSYQIISFLMRREVLYQLRWYCHYQRNRFRLLSPSGCAVTVWE
ncbi:hypothetical protein T02_13133 [Trichinella nativa]|uniref:Uncharacterized protein n=1 Tax=Trichinella nativa TaxID=6335 RepID=A0A0V1LU92_9BILA|nr:hypothetical protein T02_13133 [Trichinella nativa]